MNRSLLWAPLAIFALLFAIVASGLIKPADRTVRSALVGHSLPEFTLPAMVAAKPGIAVASLHAGPPHLLNIFASWCLPCIAEAPQLMRLKALGVPIDGVAVHDRRIAIDGFLAHNGDPYDRIGDDKSGSVQLAIGSSGVPESFVIDGRGRIILQHVGDIRIDDVAMIAAAVKAAR